MKKIILFFALCVGLPLLAVKCLESASAEPLAITGAFAYPTIGTMNVGAAFFEITNNSDKADAIIAAETEIAGRTELHDHIHENGVMRMRMVEEVALPAKQTVKLKSGGLHVMLFDLQQKLKLGDSFPLTLKLKSGTTVKTTVKVEDRD